MTVTYRGSLSSAARVYSSGTRTFSFNLSGTPGTYLVAPAQAGDFAVLAVRWTSSGTSLAGLGTVTVSGGWALLAEAPARQISGTGSPYARVSMWGKVLSAGDLVNNAVTATISLPVNVTFGANSALSYLGGAQGFLAGYGASLQGGGTFVPPAPGVPFALMGFTDNPGTSGGSGITGATPAGWQELNVSSGRIFGQFHPVMAGGTASSLGTTTTGTSFYGVFAAVGDQPFTTCQGFDGRIEAQSFVSSMSLTLVGTTGGLDPADYMIEFFDNTGSGTAPALSALDSGPWSLGAFPAGTGISYRILNAAGTPIVGGGTLRAQDSVSGLVSEVSFRCGTQNPGWHLGSVVAAPGGWSTHLRKIA